MRIKLTCIKNPKTLYISILIGLFIVFIGTMGIFEMKKVNMEKRLNMKEAIEARKQAARKNPDDANAHFHLGYAYFNHGLYNESIEAYKQAIRINPDDADAHYNLGVTYDFLNDGDSALEEYEILKTLDSEMANKLFNFINME